MSTYRSSGSAHRNSASTHRPLSSRERFRIHSSIFSRLNSRSSMASSNFNVGTTTSTPTSETPTFTTSSSLSSSTTSPTLRLRRCALRLGPTTTSWCLSVGPEPSNSFFTRNTSQATSSSGAITNPTYTSYSDRGIFSTRESIPNRSEGSNFSVVQPHRLRLDEAHRSSVSDRNSAESSSNSVQRENIFNNDPSDRLTALRLNFNSDSSRSNAAATTNSNFNMERETSSSTLPSRRFTHDLTQSPHRSSVNEESNLLNDPSLPTRSSSRFHSSPVALRNDNTGRRFRRRNNFDEILLGSSRRQNRPLSPDLMRHRPVPRLHVRSRFQEQSQVSFLISGVNPNFVLILFEIFTLKTKISVTSTSKQRNPWTKFTKQSKSETSTFFSAWRPICTFTAFKFSFPTKNSSSITQQSCSVGKCYKCSTRSFSTKVFIYYIPFF